MSALQPVSAPAAGGPGAVRRGRGEQRPPGTRCARSAPTTGRSRSPTTWTAGSAPPTAWRFARSSSWSAAEGSWRSAADRRALEHAQRAGAAGAGRCCAPRRADEQRARADRGARVHRASAAEAEFPGLALAWMTVEVRPLAPVRGGSRSGCAQLSDRVHGASVVAMRTQPIPHAYRAFFRQIGLDPDATRIPSEEAAVARLAARRLSLDRSARGRAADRAGRDGRPGVGAEGGPGRRRRAWHPHDRAAGSGSGPSSEPLAAGRLVGRGRSAASTPLLFGPIAPGHERGSSEHAASRCLQSGSTGSRRSTSRRRCGPAGRSSAACSHALAAG